jgi:predicted TIM-barrel fold metal-dependent hydrolase
MAWEPVITFCQKVLGMDRVLYAMDYPYQYEAGEVRTSDKLPLTAADKKLFFQQNAETAFSLYEGRLPFLDPVSQRARRDRSWFNHSQP